MKVQKARPKNFKAKPKKAKKKVQREVKPKITSRMIHRSIVETLQNNSEGEFNLPSQLIRYLDKNHPSYSRGLHREYYIPLSGTTRFHLNDTPQALEIYAFQAGIVMNALGEGIPIREKKYDPPFCKEHQ